MSSGNFPPADCALHPVSISIVFLIFFNMMGLYEENTSINKILFVKFYWGAKGVWRASVVSMITKCTSDHRSDPGVLEWERRFTLGLNTAKNTFDRINLDL